MEFSCQILRVIETESMSYMKKIILSSILYEMSEQDRDRHIYIRRSKYNIDLYYLTHYIYFMPVSLKIRKIIFAKNLNVRSLT